jgi:hypothetical protein
MARYTKISIAEIEKPDGLALLWVLTGDSLVCAEHLSWSRSSTIFFGGIVIATLLGDVLSGTPARADATACKGLASALLTNAETPYHSASIITFNPTATAGDMGTNPQPPTSQTSETIFNGKAIFVRFGSGKWQLIHASLDKLKELVRLNAESFTDCRRLGDETVDGATLAVYEGHRVSQKLVVATTKVWVAPDRGVLIRSETDIIGGSAPRNVVIHYEYKDIAAPADAQ